MSAQPERGRFAVTRRAIVDIVRASALGSYGVAGIGSRRLVDRLQQLTGLAEPGIRVDLQGGLRIDLDLRVARGLPIAEVARQVESAVRYGLRRALGVEPKAVTIHVRGLATALGTPPPPAGARAEQDHATREAVGATAGAFEERS
jgi:uncharacterized alkaline shock family protein YloU